MIFEKNEPSKKRKHRFHDIGFKQGHGGRERFYSGEWGASTEFSPSNEYRESDSYDQLNATGIDFDINESDDDLYSREFNRSRFADSALSQGYVGKGPKGYIRSDERIYEDACEILYKNPTVDASDIQVKVDDGLMTLNGTVNSFEAKVEAEHCLERIIGVIRMKNNLTIKEPS